MSGRLLGEIRGGLRGMRNMLKPLKPSSTKSTTTNTTTTTTTTTTSSAAAAAAAAEAPKKLSLHDQLKQAITSKFAKIRTPAKAAKDDEDDGEEWL